MSPLRWAARYAFVDELWRDRARIIVDAHIERLLVEDHTLGSSAEELLDALLPRSRGGAPVWMVVDGSRINAFRSRRPGTTFIDRSDVVGVMSRNPWEVLLLDASGLVAGQTQDYAEAIARQLRAWSLPAGQHQAVVITAPARDQDSDDDSAPGLGYDDAVDLVGERLGGGRVFGLYMPPMAAIADFGGRVEPTVEPVRHDFGYLDSDDPQTVEISVTPLQSPLDRSIEDLEEQDTDDEGLDDDEDVPLVYDNTLGSSDPILDEYVCVAGGSEVTEMLGEGLTLVELPTTSNGVVLADDSALRLQLTRAQAEADHAALERQREVERVVTLERENETLREQLSTSAAATVADELEASRAREQALKWKVAQLEHELAQAIARPVSELEAEVARLQAELEARDAQDEDQEDDEDESTTSEPNGTGDDAPVSPVEKGPLASTFAGLSLTSHQTAMIRMVDSLVRRIERGGMGTLQLRRELVQLRQRMVGRRGDTARS